MRCPTLTMRLGLFRPNSIVFEPSGTQTVTFGPMPPVAITATRAVVIASGLLVGGPNDISVEISGLRALPMDAGPDTALTVAALKATMRDRGATGSAPA